MNHNMKLKNGPYNSILYGKKDIELRLYDEKRQKVHVGDAITFTNIESSEEFTALVEDLYIEKSFKEIYESFDKERLGYSKDDIPSYKDMEKYYSEEEINKYGVVGIKIKVINK